MEIKTSNDKTLIMSNEEFDLLKQAISSNQITLKMENEIFKQFKFQDFEDRTHELMWETIRNGTHALEVYDVDGRNMHEWYRNDTKALFDTIKRMYVFSKTFGPLLSEEEKTLIKTWYGAMLYFEDSMNQLAHASVMFANLNGALEANEVCPWLLEYVDKIEKEN